MDKLSRHSKIMGELKELIGKEKVCAETIDRTQEGWSGTLDAAIERTKEEFFVVVMGNFSAGKSTMINALIGDNVLPSCPIPTTAVMTELRYGEEKKIIMYPKKGQNVDGYGDQPFVVPATMNAIERYITIDNDAGINEKSEDSVEIASKFEKMELYWPLDMLKNGVVIVDSPGLNDPYSNDVIVKNYLPRADAIIYALNTTAPYQGTDKKELTALNEFGIKNIIFACTYWDMVRSGGERATGKTRDYCVSSALKHTDLGEEAVHFLASKDGLHAQIEKDSDLWTASGYAEFAKYLQEYLTTRRGRDKVNNIVAAMAAQAEAMKKQAIILDENASKDKDIIEKDIAAAKEKLEGLKKDAKSIHSTFLLKLENRKPAVEAKILEGLRGLKDRVNLDGFTPVTELPTGWGKLKPGAKKVASEAIAEEFQDEYKARMEKALLKYQSTNVSNEMQEAVKYAAQSIEEDITALNNELDRIDVSVGLPSAHTEQAGGNPLFGVAYGLITGDWWTGGSIALYGGAGRQLGYQLATGLGVGVALSMGVISLPIAGIALLASNLIAVVTEDNEKQITKIRQSTLESLQKLYFDGGDEAFIEPTAKAIMAKTEDIFDKAAESVMAAITATFAEKEQALETVLKEADLEKTEKDRLVEARKTAIADLEAIVEEAMKLQAEY